MRGGGDSRGCYINMADSPCDRGELTPQFCDNDARSSDWNFLIGKFDIYSEHL